jgi:hypothetical protein
MSWTRLGFTLYIFSIINYCYAFYSITQSNVINMIISFATYLILAYTSESIEEA